MSEFASALDDDILNDLLGSGGTDYELRLVAVIDRHACEGKPARGSLKLRMQPEDGFGLRITIEDDGARIHADRLLLES